MRAPFSQYLSSPVTEKDTLEGSTDDLSYGISAHQGWRKNMEDAHIAHHISKDTYLFGIFDGHGEKTGRVLRAPTGALGRALSYP